jgi:hypothetical protein
MSTPSASTAPSPASFASSKARARPKSPRAKSASRYGALKSLDDVAYVRFASVYRNFREAKDFHDVLGELKGDELKGDELKSEEDAG